MRRRILGEDLVLFRDDKGGSDYWRCAARIAAPRWNSAISRTAVCAAAIMAGFTMSKGKSWKCRASRPTAPSDNGCAHPAYKVQELGGVVFAYLGPEPASLLPRWDVLVREDGVRARRARTVNCNFFQMIENSVDQNHLRWLHRTAATPTWDDGEINPQVFEYGVLNTYTRRVADGKRYAHVNFFVMPTMNKTGNVEEGHPDGAPARAAPAK